MKAEPHGPGRFRILGPLEVRSPQGWTDIGPVEWRALLACLLLSPGQVVPAEILIFGVWGDSPPPMASNLVSIYAHRLRRLVGDEDGQVIACQEPGYLIRCGTGDLDLERFVTLVADGRSALAAGDPKTAAEVLAEALSLWRGPALADVPATALISAQAERLASLRLAATELRAEAELACGRGTHLVAGLRRLTADHPIREELRLLLIRALNEPGRKTEAVKPYDQTTQVNGSELGDDPGADPRQMHPQLLAADARNAAMLADAPPHSGPEGREAGVQRLPAALAPGPHGERPTGGPKARHEELAGREEFGRALEAARARAGLTVQKAARAAGISPGEAAAFFAGSDLPPVTEAGLKALHRMLAACGIADPGQIITWTYALAKAWSLPAYEAPAGDAPRRPGAASGGIIEDIRGFDLCPDPLTAQTAAELVAALSRFRLWAGEPSFQEMRRLSQPEAAASTMCEALGSSSLPSLRVVQAIVTGCGGTPEHKQAFTTAWRNIRMNQGKYGAQPGIAIRRNDRAALVVSDVREFSGAFGS